MQNQRGEARGRYSGERRVPNPFAGPGSVEGAPRGRYSRQVLKPEQLLDELALSRPNRPERPTQSLDNQTKVPFSHPTRAKSRALHDLCFSTPNSTLAQRWAALVDLSGDQRAKDIIKMRTVSSCFISILARSCEELSMRGLQVGSPRPSEVLALGKENFGIVWPTYWTKPLWWLSRWLIRAWVSGVGEERTLEELMVVWHMAFRERLQRENGPAKVEVVKSLDLDWSFLPPQQVLITMLRSSSDLIGREQSAQKRFHAALQLLLPKVREEEEIYDYVSSALVTWDAIHQSGKQGDSLHLPFVEVVDVIRQKTPPMKVTKALAEYAEEVARGGNLEEYVGMLERMGLITVAELKEDIVARMTAATASTRFDSPTAEPMAPGIADIEIAAGAEPENVERRGKLMYGYESQGEGELSVSEGQEVVVLEADDGSGWVRVRKEGAGEASELEGYVPASYLVMDVSADQDILGSSQQEAGATAPAAQAQPRRTNTLQSRDEVTNRFTNKRIEMLLQAQQRSDLTLAERIKKDILHFDSDPLRPPLSDHLYEMTMQTLLMLSSPTSMIEVWNRFIQHGRQPTAKTYTMLMRGAQQMRDIAGQESFWHKMRMGGVQPDANAWNTRIYGLLKGHTKTERGLQALKEFGDEWITAARAKKAETEPVVKKKRTRQGEVASPQEEVSAAELNRLFPGDVDGVAKPDVVTMNSAISGLASKAERFIPMVLQWGRIFDLQPDGTTYNTLLNLAMRHGDSDQAFDILRRMREENIETTTDTSTIMLNAVFRDSDFEDLSQQEQTERILSILTSFESIMTGIDEKGYALVVDRLLKTFHNIEAADAVIEHMSKRGIEPSTHIYTILMTHYFQQQPQPDFASIDALWRRIQAADNGRGAKLDGIFHDRMIEGYAAHASTIGTQPLISSLDRMSAENKRPSWQALLHAARALADAGQWDRMLKIVDEARMWLKEEQGKRTEVVTGPRAWGQREFWQFVIDTGLLREERITRPDQIMRNSTGQTPLQRRIWGERQQGRVR